MRLIRQFHGDLVTVPPATTHCVVNLQACCKVAWDFYKPEHMTAYLLAARHCSKFFGNANAEDLMSVGAVLIAVIRHILEDNNLGKAS